MGNLQKIDGVYGVTDFVVRLGDAAGSNKFIVQDSAGEEVASIDSNGVVTGSELSGIDMPWMITIFPTLFSTVEAGNALADAADPSQYFCHAPRQSAAANGDTLSWPVVLSAGTYSLIVLGVTTTNRGVADYYLNSTEIASFDWYSVGSTMNAKKTQTGITVATSGKYLLKQKVDGKHASSSDYLISSTAIMLVRTA
jgi:hypothetical protein